MLSVNRQRGVEEALCGRGRLSGAGWGEPHERMEGLIWKSGAGHPTHIARSSNLASRAQPELQQARWREGKRPCRLTPWALVNLSG